MALLGVDNRYRLGIANAVVSYGPEFARDVMKLSATCLVYQQHLVHSNQWDAGPAAASADYCYSADSTANSDPTSRRILRQVAAHDSQFGRMNVTQSPNYKFTDFTSSFYYNQYYGQKFYVGNEPEAPAFPNIHRLAAQCYGGNCWDPPSWEPTGTDTGRFPIDPYFAGYFPGNDNPNFWKKSNPAHALGMKCRDNRYTPRIIQPGALAYVYLTLKRLAENAGRDHIVLPPAAIKPLWGADEGTNPYWDTFFGHVHGSGIGYSGAPFQNRLSDISQLRALHCHQYLTRWFGTATTDNAVENVADVARYMWRGVQWYRSKLRVLNVPGADSPLPLDYVLSETGIPNWETALYGRPRGWTGGYDNFLKGLIAWNSFLCYLTRRAPFELGLKDWQSGMYTLYAGLHDPGSAPYFVRKPEGNSLFNLPTISSNQYYFDLDYWNAYSWYSAPAFDINHNANPNPPPPNVPIPPVEYGNTQYHNRFPAIQGTSWGGTTWYMAPLGACWWVWNQVGSDPNVLNYVGPDGRAAGWYDDRGLAGSRGVVSVDVPGGGWSTIYIPFIKGSGENFPAYGGWNNSRYNIIWHHRNGAPIREHGYLDLTLLPNTKNRNLYSYDTFSAMVLPLLVYSSQPQPIRIELQRNLGGTPVFVGRPVVLGGVACTWSGIH